MPFKFDFRNFLLAIIFSLIAITIISLLVSQYTNLSTIKTGKAFLIIFIGTFLTILFLAAYDKKIQREELITLVVVSILLTVSYIALYKFVPDIFSIFPEQLKNVFSAIGI